MTFNWSGQAGQPTWLWGGTDGTNMYVYNPSNFNVNSATTATTASNANALGGVALAASGTGSSWPAVPYVQSNGVIEIGRYIDFHNSSGDGSDYSVRLETGNSTTDLYLNNNKVIHAGNIAGYIPSAIPAGAVMHFAMANAPSGWLKANGAQVSRSTYSALFSIIGTTYGGGDGFSTFNLPDLRGEFIRGYDDGRGADSGRGFGTFQDQQLGWHTHTGTTSNPGSHQHSFPTFARDGSQNGSVGDGGPNRTYTSYTSIDGAHTHTFTTDGTGGNETRPRNVALLACIKY